MQHKGFEDEIKSNSGGCISSFPSSLSFQLHSGLWLMPSSTPLGIGSDFTSQTIKPAPLWRVLRQLTFKGNVRKEKPKEQSGRMSSCFESIAKMDFS